jgi:integrase
LKREHWQSTSPIRDIFKAAFENAGFPYFHPHSLRHTIAQLGERVCRTPEELKAWSQNMLHENVLTMFTSYGKVSDHRQAELIKGLNTKTQSQNNSVDELDDETRKKLLKFLRKKNTT